MGRVERQWDIPILIIFILPVLHLREDSGCLSCQRISNMEVCPTRSASSSTGTEPLHKPFSMAPGKCIV